MNKCEEMNIQHAWRNANEMWGFSVQATQTCANCGLKRTKHSQTEEWWSYSDDSPNEKIINIRPV